MHTLGSTETNAPELNIVAACSVQEYCAYKTVRTADHFACIARARSEKPKRQIDDAAKIQERPVGVEGGGPDGEGDAHVEAAAARMHAGLAVVGRNAVISHRFDDKTLGDIIDSSKRRSEQKAL